MSDRLHRNSWIITVPLAAAAAAYLLLFFLPGRRANATLAEELAEKQECVAQATTVAATLRATEQELDRTQEYIAAWKHNAPADGSRSLLYGRLHEVAKASGVTIIRFDPKPVEPRAQIRGFPVVIGCTGKYAQVHEFLRGLESHPAAIWADTVSIKRPSENSETIECEISMVIFANNPEISD
jgi:Tfp pilus assembly protein PilO